MYKVQQKRNFTLAHDSIYTIARYMLSSIRLSVRLPHGWISQRRLKLGSCNFHHWVAPWLLVSSWLTTPWWEHRGRQMREG